MAFRVLRTVGLFAVLGLSITSMVFVLLGITSQEWAKREYYDTATPEDWATPNLTVYRNPFKLCSTTPVYNITTDDQGVISKDFLGFTQSCQSYSPSGTNRTSCELPWVLATYRNLTNTLQDATAVRGDARLCQQIHYAGNFAISGTIFISLGAMMAICMTLGASYATAFRDAAAAEAQRSHAPNASGGKTDIQDTITESNSSTTGQGKIRRHATARNLNFVTVNVLRIGVVLTILSQYFGILGLIQSSPNNSDFASSAFGPASAEDSNLVGYHGPWYQGKGLSVYMTCGWAFALASSVVATKLWRT